MHKTKMATGAGDISLPDVSKLNDLKDDQIEALIEKLAEVQAHAPQIIAALEAQQEARSRGSKSQGSKGDRKGSSSDRGERTQPPKQYMQQPTVEEEEEEDEDDEDYDDFDEDAEYPMVGDGYSDEISVVSDMTTPTVVSSLEINEEEYYRDMVVGGMKVNAPKKKDLLSSVAKANARKAPVAGLAPKKKAAASDMALKKPARVASMHSARPDKAVAAATKTGEAVKKKKVKDGSTTPTGTKKVKKKAVKKKAASPNSSGSGWDAANGGGPSSGSGKKKGPQEKAAPVMIDDDGFLVDQSTFETFDSSNNPFARAPSFTADPNSAEDAFGTFASFGDPEPAPKKASKPKKLNVSSTGKKKNSGSSSQAGSSPKSKRKGTRRASLGM